MNPTMNADGVSEPRGKILLDEPSMLKPEEVAVRLRCNIKTVYLALRRKQLPYTLLGARTYRIPRRAIESIEHQGRVALPGGKHGSATR